MIRNLRAPALAVLGALALLAAPAVADDERTKAIEDLLPGDTIALFTVHDMETFRTNFEKTGLHGIWAEPEFQRFLDSFWGGIQKYYDSMKEDFEKSTGVAFDKVLECLQGELAIAFVGMEKGEAEPEPGIVFTIEAGKNLPIAIELVAGLRKKIQEENPGAQYSTRDIDGITIQSLGDAEFTLQYASFAGGFYFATTAELIDTVVQNFLAEPDGSLAQSEAFRDVKARFGAGGGEYLLYINAKQAFEEFDEEIPEEAKKVLDGIGLTDWSAAGMAGEFTENEWRETLALSVPGEKKGMNFLFADQGAVDLSRASEAPADSTTYSAIRFDLTGLYDEVLATVERIDESAARDLKKGIADFEKEHNLGVRDDLLGSIGNELHSFAFTPEGGSLVPHGVTTLALKDPATFEKTIEKLLAGQSLFEAKSIEYQGKTIRYLSAPLGELGENPFEGMEESPDAAIQFGIQFAFGSMAWYVEDGWLVTSNLVQALEDYIDYLKEGTGSLTENDEFRAAVESAGKAGFFAWSDPRPFVGQIYNTVLPVLRMIEGIARRAGVPLDVALLPRAKTILAHLSPSVYLARMGDGGVTVHGTALFPGTLVGFSVAGVAAAVAIPGLIQARLSANETAAIGTLKSLATSQEQFKFSTLVDADSDGTGEYGYFQELAGTSETRSGAKVDPSFLTSVLGESAAENGGIAEKNGYHFLIYLPGKDAAMREKATLPAADPGVANAQETRWVCYAWPVEFEKTGRRVFCITQEGQVYETHNYSTTYSGAGKIPEAGAAYDQDGQGDPANLENGVATGGGRSGDGNFWFPSGG
ncbi:MAG: DUF2950 family protein [Planctomycetes bacterium]|nr:DUF2950 family protein [Planctomycetota bacterium]